ncbi:Isocitrate dehydrogenase [NADP] 2 [Symbiodinium microadriaticum]|uniref:Isocitrate dehydrogenase [NADP] 2 n=1 Tax=Symbiodinium microadriaticum TaxID=2951 RepID=A0A1Q9ERY1_SYMMI|nr:Isocitrate dehydrogenase [NADP] 2 [Symbiodinium microadriaticum]
MTAIACAQGAAASLAAALSRAVGRFLDANKNPSRKVKEIDNRGSHYWVARYWAEELASQEEEQRLKAAFSSVADQLKEKEVAILSDMIECQGKSVDIGGYYHVDKAKADVAMNPSATFNGIITRLAEGPDARCGEHTDEAQKKDYTGCFCGKRTTPQVGMRRLVAIGSCWLARGSDCSCADTRRPPPTESAWRIAQRAEVDELLEKHWVRARARGEGPDAAPTSLPRRLCRPKLRRLTPAAGQLGGTWRRP